MSDMRDDVDKQGSKIDNLTTQLSALLDSIKIDREDSKRRFDTMGKQISKIKEESQGVFTETSYPTSFLEEDDIEDEEELGARVTSY